MAPAILNNTSVGINALKNAGVDKNFIDSMYRKYGKYAGKLGMSDDSVKGMIDQIGNAVGNNNPRMNNQTPTKRNVKSGFNSKKYPKV